MTRPGLKKVQCEVCGETRELEIGIKKMFHCAQPMVEVKEGEVEEKTMRLQPRR